VFGLFYPGQSYFGQSVNMGTFPPDVPIRGFDLAAETGIDLTGTIRRIGTVEGRRSITQAGISRRLSRASE
jgi:hypothetical protein